MGRLLAALTLVPAVAVAQEHAYEPDVAWLAHATEKWLVWVPDDQGASLDPPAENGEAEADEDDGDGDPEIKKYQPLAKPPKLGDFLKTRAIYVLQHVGDPKQVRKVVLEWKDPREKPIGLRPVTVLDDGTVVLTGLKRDELILCRPDTAPSPAPCIARGMSAVLVAAYPDGAVLQTPPPDDPKPAGPDPRVKDAALYWVRLDSEGLQSDKARRMSFPEGVPTKFRLHVTRFGDDVAMPGGVYSPALERRQRFHSKNAMSIYAYDGRVALGMAFPFAVRESDSCGMVDDHEYFLARDGIGYWLEEGAAGRWTIRACRLRSREAVLSLGHVRFLGTMSSPPRYVEGSTLALDDRSSKTRFTIYWTVAGLRWTGEGGWQSRAWLQEKDFR